MNDAERTWVGNALATGGSFVKAFAAACCAADASNFMLLQPVLWSLMDKYPRYAAHGSYRPRRSHEPHNR